MNYRDLSPEELARMASPVYTPPPEFDDRQAYVYEAEPDAYEHDRLGRRLSVTFAMLAGFVFGLGVAWALS